MSWKWSVGDFATSQLYDPGFGPITCLLFPLAKLDPMVFNVSQHYLHAYVCVYISVGKLFLVSLHSSSTCPRWYRFSSVRGLVASPLTRSLWLCVSPLNWILERPKAACVKNLFSFKTTTVKSLDKVWLMLGGLGAGIRASVSICSFSSLFWWGFWTLERVSKLYFHLWNQTVSLKTLVKPHTF